LFSFFQDLGAEWPEILKKQTVVNAPPARASTTKKIL